MYKEEKQSKFSINKFIIFSASIFSEFGVKIEVSRKRLRTKDILNWGYIYQLQEERKNLKYFLINMSFALFF